MAGRLDTARADAGGFDPNAPTLPRDAASYRSERSGGTGPGYPPDADGTVTTGREKPSAIGGKARNPARNPVSVRLFGQE